LFICQSSQLGMFTRYFLKRHDARRTLMYQFGRKPDQCMYCYSQGCKVDGQYVSSRLTSKHFVIEYKCPKCDKPFYWRRTWRLGHSQPINCSVCGNTGSKVHQIQTGKFRNETERVVEVEVKCPNPKCEHIGWVPIQTDEIVMF